MAEVRKYTLPGFTAGALIYDSVSIYREKYSEIDENKIVPSYNCDGLFCSCCGYDDCNVMFLAGVCGSVASCSNDPNCGTVCACYQFG